MKKRRRGWRREEAGRLIPRKGCPIGLDSSQIEIDSSLRVLLVEPIIEEGAGVLFEPVWITIGGRTLGRLVEVLSKFGLSAAGILL